MAKILELVLALVGSVLVIWSLATWDRSRHLLVNKWAAYIGSLLMGIGAKLIEC